MSQRFKLTIAIDFDDTFTADPKAWTEVIAVLHAAGHKVICVSARSDIDGNRRELMAALPSGVEVLLSEHHQKSTFAQSKGHRADIWIDDMPSAIPSLFELRHAELFATKAEATEQALKKYKIT